jgi:hypothetical protein
METYTAHDDDLKKSVATTGGMRLIQQKRLE